MALVGASIRSNRTARSTSIPARPAYLSPSPRKRRKGLAPPVDPDAPPISPVSLRALRARTRGSFSLVGWCARWRVVGVLGAAVLVVGLVAVWSRDGKEPLRIPKRPYDLQPYRHLDFSLPITLAPATRIFHVTKEFGPATMGGLGVMLTALSIAQAESPFLAVSTILPFYSFLLTDYPSQISHFAHLRIPVAGIKGRKPKTIGCVVSLLKWEYSSAADFLHPDHEEDPAAIRRSIDIYLIGPGDQKPFNVAFRAKDAGDVYSAYKPLKQEWKDLWFAKAAAELIKLLGHDPESLSGEDGLDWELELQDASAIAERGVDVVHLHGATNAMVGYFLRHPKRPSPAIVYTLHDSLDEVEYSNLVSNSLAFLDDHSLSPAFLEGHSTYIVGKQLFPSALGIDAADAVTFVSQSIAADIVEGRFQFALRDLVMPSIARRAKERAFVGITNGLDFTDPAKNPFTSPALVSRGLAFPRVGANVTDPSTFFAPTPARKPPVPLIPPAPTTTATYSSLTPISFASTKQRAKQHLIEHLPSHFGFTPLDADRPFFLFIGRFQYNKGCQFFEPILQHLSISASGRLILMGARNNYPHAFLRRLSLMYPLHLTFIDSIDEQREWGTLMRMASDFALVPSFSEAFGLVAAEGMLFGMSVVSSNVGGLAEFLVPIEREGDAGNAYTFDLFAGADVSAENSRVGIEELGEAVKACVVAVDRAIDGWRARRKGGMDAWRARESFVRSRVAEALELKWSREKGPIEEYVHVYDLAISSRRGASGSTLPPPVIDHPVPLDHPVVAPAIAHGGHDQVSGQEGAEALQRVLPVYKVWSWSDDEGARRKAHKATMETKASEKQKKEKEKERLARKGGSRLGW